ncbi:MAG: flagellar L-ring protein FlgH [Phycisphaeraceae bacterium]|nr:MAG: flagellar L-ring protein FlgH [Phycisphaeraceae bacterium]
MTPRSRCPMLVLILFATPACAQGLYAPVAETAENRGQPLRLEQVSVLYVEPPEPRVIQKHDLITIVIDESSTASSSQELETSKSYDTSASVNAVVDPWHLLEARLRQGDLTGVDLIAAEADRDYSGEGDYQRRDRFSARITATVLEVKPNGTLLLEARKHIERDEEISDLVLSGYVRQDDVTRQNTVLSSQMASLRIELQNEGEVRQAAQKGLLTQILDTIFAF